MSISMFFKNRISVLLSFAIIQICFLNIAYGQSENVNSETRLVIKPEGHTSTIRKILVTKDKKYIISASDDKSVKIWDAKSGEIVDEILGEIGSGPQGVIYSIALSPDERWLAVSGILNGDKNEMSGGRIRIYDFKTRKLVRTLERHFGAVGCLSFNDESDFLVSGGSDDAISTWWLDPEQGGHSTRITAHKATVQDVVCVSNSVISCSEDGTVQIHNIFSGKKVKKQTGFGLLRSVAITETDYSIAVGAEDNKIHLLNSKLKPLQVLENKTCAMDLAFSEDGKKLIAGAYQNDNTSNKDNPCNLYQKTNDGIWKLTHTFNEHDYYVAAVAFYNKDTVITAGGHKNEIIMWVPKANGEIEIVKRMNGKGAPIWGVSKLGSTVLFTRNKTKELGLSKPDMAFDLLTGEIYKPELSGEKKIQGPMLKRDQYSFQIKKGGIYKYESAVLELRNADTLVKSIVKDNSDGYEHFSLTFLKDYGFVSGGGNGFLYGYRDDGQRYLEFTGHEGPVWSVSQGRNPKWVISASEDQTFRIWNLDSAKKRVLNNLDYMDETWIEHCKEQYPDIDVEKDAAAEKYYEALKKAGDHERAEQLVGYRFLEPTVSGFISEDGEWILWSPDGYFKSSKNGAKYIGYHVNNGVNKEAEFYPFQQFDLKYNRPDIINSRLEIGDQAYNDLLNQAHDKRVRKMGFEESELNGDIHLPKIRIGSSGTGKWKFRNQRIHV